MTRKETAAALKERILLAALQDAPFDGWGGNLLESAARRLKISEDRVREAFPGGAEDLVRFFSEWADRKAVESLPAKRLASMRVRDKIALGVRTRLEILAPHRQAVSASLAYSSVPPRNLLLPKLVWKTADALWRAAGDASTDYNYYTKRLLLAGVITSTTLYWLNDKSKGGENTWRFLERRIENVLKLGQRLGGLRKKGEGR